MTRNRLFRIILASEKMMKVSKRVLLALVLCSISILSLSCASGTDSTDVPENQVVTVQRGNLVIDVTAAGNLALSHTEDIVIDLFYGQAGTSGTKGTVSEVLVEEGDSVKEGQVLAKLDTTEWDEQLKTLEKALVTDQRSLTSKERDLTSDESQVTTKERDIAKAERQVTAKELAVRQAQLDLETAEDNLYETAEVASEKVAVDAAEFELRVAQATGETYSTILYWQDRLAQAEEDLQEALNSSSATDSDDAALQFAISQLQVEQKKAALEDAEIAVEDANLAVDEARLDKEYAEQDMKDAKLDVEYAKQDVEDAQSALDEANSLSPIIIAPFDGFITRVNVEGGDEVMTGTVAVQLADPTKFEAEITVSEMDISQVELGGEASVEVDALGLSLPAVVTYIAPTATIQSGVVNYKVKVEIQSLEAVQQEWQEAREEAMQDISSGELPERLKQAIEEGSITQELAEEMRKQRLQGEGGQLEGGQGQMLMIPEDFQLREGLTVTVSIVVAERNDVLLVPNAAITNKGRQNYVQVVLPDGTTEERVVVVGISDWQYTEVTEGLSEGEEVVVPQGTTITPSTQQQPPGGMVPGVGRMLR